MEEAETQHNCVSPDMVFKRAYAASKKDVSHAEFVKRQYKEYCNKMEKVGLTPALYFTWLQCQK